MTYDEALRKAISCLKLAKSANQHESALAAAKAQEIIDRYELSVEDINAGGESKDKDEAILDYGDEAPLQDCCGADTKWTLCLAVAIANLNACRIYYTSYITSSSRVKIVGRVSDVQTVRYIFGWLEQEVRRLSKQECAGYPRKYQSEFRMGVVDTIRVKLQQQRRDTIRNVQSEAVNPMALMRIQQSIARLEAKGSAVDQWMKDNLELRQAKSRAVKVNLNARVHGQLAGTQVRFNQAKAGIGAPVDRNLVNA